MLHANASKKKFSIVYLADKYAVGADFKFLADVLVLVQPEVSLIKISSIICFAKDSGL